MSKQYTIPEILSAEIEALRTIPQDNDYEAAIRLILGHVHQGGGRLITSGMGKAGQIAHNIATPSALRGRPLTSSIRAKHSMATWGWYARAM